MSANPAMSDHRVSRGGVGTVDRGSDLLPATKPAQLLQEAQAYQHEEQWMSRIGSS